jgi:hypothetical protein
MRATLYQYNPPDPEPVRLGDIMVVGNKAVGQTAVQQYMIDKLPVEAGKSVTPKDGEAYLRRLQAEFTFSSRLALELFDDDGNRIKVPH